MRTTGSTPEPGQADPAAAQSRVEPTPATGCPDPSSESPAARRTGRHGPGTLVGIVLGVVAVQALLLTLFAWPALHSAPRDLPVVVAGPAAATAPVAKQLESTRPGAFDVTTSTSAARADDKLRDRDAYAAFVVTPRGLRVHVASAASDQIATLFRQVAQRTAAQTGRPVPVTDVVPADPDDPHGVVPSIGVLPLALTSMAAGILLGLLVRTRWGRLVGVLLFAALAGLSSVGIAQYSLSALPGDYLGNAAGVAFLALCVSAVLAGLVGLLGLRGAGLGALIVFVLGIPLSGVTSSPDLLPTAWGTLGQYLPPGAGGALVRSVAFFDGAGTTRPLAVLAAWTLLGLVLLALGRRRRAPLPA
ncbi:MAG: hypothetical protein WCA46_23975 [Actinocatenispora sp.]